VEKLTYACMLVQSLDALHWSRRDTIDFVNMFTCQSYTIEVNGFLSSAIPNKVPTIDTPSQSWPYSQTIRYSHDFCKIVTKDKRYATALTPRR
jgi:hypothetical protein